MTYLEFQDRIAEGLRQSPDGLTWVQLRESLGLPYDRPCQTWVARLESEIGLQRTRSGRSKVWTLKQP